MKRVPTGELGVTFSIVDDEALLPIIAVEGSPTVAFTGSGADNPMSSLAAGLTDPLIGGQNSVPNDIAMDFDLPVTSVQPFIIDIDVSDEFSLVAFDGGVTPLEKGRPGPVWSRPAV